MDEWSTRFLGQTSWQKSSLSGETQVGGRKFWPKPTNWEPNWQQERLGKRTWLATDRLKPPRLGNIRKMIALVVK